MSFEHLKVGDRVYRLLGGKVTMEMEVTEVKDEIIVCGVVTKAGKVAPFGWEFDRKTGMEEDDDLGWGVAHGATGSYLTEKLNHEA